MVVTKPSVKHLHRKVAALFFEMVLDWKFLWQNVLRYLKLR